MRLIGQAEVFAVEDHHKHHRRNQRRDGDGRLTERITAESASWTDGAWRLAGASAWKVTETCTAST